MQTKLKFWLCAILLVNTSLSFSYYPIETGEPIETYKSNLSGNLRIAKPTELRSMNNAFQIVYEGSWSVAEKNAFEMAVHLWESALWPVQGVKIQVRFSDLEDSVLATTETTTIDGSYFGRNREDVGDLQSFAKYPTSLAKRMSADTSISGNSPDIIITFNNDKSLWYLDVDGVVPINKYDFVTASLRELAKGFGFYTRVSKYGTRITYKSGAAESPLIYDTYILNTANKYLTTFAFADVNIANYVQRINNYAGRDIYFASNPTVKLYAPTAFENRKTLMYFDTEAYNDTESALMAPDQRKGDAVHKIGAKILKVLETIGWYKDGTTVGFYTNPFVSIYCSLAEGYPIQFNTNYTYRAIPQCNEYCIIYSSNWKFEVLKKDGTYHTIIPSTPSAANYSFVLNLNSSSIPTGDWATNEAGYIKGHVIVSGNMSGGIDFLVDYDVLIPPKPEAPANPILDVQNILDYPEEWLSDVTLGFYSQGASSYLLTQQMIGDITLMLYPISNAKNTFTAEQIFLDCAYRFKIKAINATGESAYTTIEVGGDPTYYENMFSMSAPTTMTAMSVSQTGNDVVLNFGTSAGRTVNMEMQSVEIVNISTPLFAKRVQNYYGGTSINLSGMPAGIYAIKVTDKRGKNYSTKFLKK